jgi:hypothetical protein
VIYYRPTDGDVHGAGVAWRPRTCFLMSAMGGRLSPELERAKHRVRALLRAAGIGVVDASSVTTGKDYLLKVWHLAVASPIGVALVHEGIRPATMANVFYELGWMHAYGRETVVVPIGSVDLPSDLVRTEYVAFDASFSRRSRAFIDSLDDRAAYYQTLATQLERDPLLAIDYLRRAYLLTGDEAIRQRARAVFAEGELSDRARNSVERLMVAF